MPFSVEQVQGKVPVTILAIQGELDASNYLSVIDETNAVYKAGARYLLLDLREMSFISSSGLVALFSILRIFQGKQLPDPEEGWETIHSIGRSKETDTQENVKLLDPQPRAKKTLEIAGMNEFFEIHSNLDEAVASFE